MHLCILAHSSCTIFSKFHTVTIFCLCCTIFMLHFFLVALFSCLAISSCCIHFILHFFRVALFSYFAISMQHFFRVALFSCCTNFMLFFFKCCTIFLCCTISCWTFLVVHPLHVALLCVKKFFQNKLSTENVGAAVSFSCAVWSL